MQGFVFRFAMVFAAVFAVLFVLVWLFLSSAPSQAAELRPLTIETANGPKTFHVEIADTPETRERGLMFRRHMAADHGMVFYYTPPRRAVMWMKNTYLSLDMLFVNAAGEITHVAADTTPLSEALVSAEGLTYAVIELNGGTAAREGISPGDVVIFP